MRVRRWNEFGLETLSRCNARQPVIIGVACCVGLVALSLFATPCNAASIPAWLDDAITAYNKENPASPIQFVDIKDSYVWYSISSSPDIGSKEIRERVYGIAHKNGYANTQDEESVTTGKVPSVGGGPPKTRKCYTRSFLRTLKEGSGTGQQRMLTTMVCEAESSWFAGFRVIQ